MLPAISTLAPDSVRLSLVLVRLPAFMLLLIWVLLSLSASVLLPLAFTLPLPLVL
jgi:hypothetical protein